MFGFVQTPPRPSPRMPSLEPWQPTSGTTGVSASRHRRHRPVVGFQPVHGATPTSHDGGSAGITPLEKLENLTEQIRLVLRAYSNLPTRSLVYLASLKEFLRRAIELNPNAVEEEEDESPPTSPSILPGTPSPPRSQSRGAYSQDHRGGAKNALPLPRRGSSYNKAPDAAEVDKLERDWWASEVVAVWYGPRPGSRFAGDRTRVRKDSIREAFIKRDASFVGLHDESVEMPSACQSMIS